MESLQLWISIILGGMAVLTNIFLVYNYFAKKDISFDKTLGINGATCLLKHKIIDENYNKIEKAFSLISEELHLFERNGLKHIEAEQKRLGEVQVKILTILEERLREKI